MEYGKNGYEKIDPEYRKEVKQKYWDIAFGLQAVDSLQPSEYVKELSQKNVNAEMSNAEIEEALYDYYNQSENYNQRDRECDIVSNRIVELLEMDGFPFRPSSLNAIHRYLFKDIYEDAGEYRTFNMSKKEPVLYGDTVKYCNFFMIEETLKYDFENEMSKESLALLNPDAVVERIADLSSAIWQIHPFSEGNTRTTAVFIERYLNSVGYNVNNDLFKEYSKFFRNALVRSNYAAYPYGIMADKSFLIKFFENLLTTKQNDLNKLDLRLDKLKNMKILPNASVMQP